MQFTRPVETKNDVTPTPVQAWLTVRANKNKFKRPVTLLRVKLVAVFVPPPKVQCGALTDRLVVQIGDTLSGALHQCKNMGQGVLILSKPVWSCTPALALHSDELTIEPNQSKFFETQVVSTGSSPSEHQCSLSVQTNDPTLPRWDTTAVVQVVSSRFALSLQAPASEDAPVLSWAPSLETWTLRFPPTPPGSEKEAQLNLRSTTAVRIRHVDVLSERSQPDFYVQLQDDQGIQVTFHPSVPNRSYRQAVTLQVSYENGPHGLQTESLSLFLEGSTQAAFVTKKPRQFVHVWDNKPTWSMRETAPTLYQPTASLLHVAWSDLHNEISVVLKGNSSSFETWIRKQTLSSPSLGGRLRPPTFSGTFHFYEKPTGTQASVFDQVDVPTTWVYHPKRLEILTYLLFGSGFDLLSVANPAYSAYKSSTGSWYGPTSQVGSQYATYAGVLFNLSSFQHLPETSIRSRIESAYIGPEIWVGQTQLTRKSQDSDPSVPTDWCTNIGGIIRLLWYHDISTSPRISVDVTAGMGYAYTDRCLAGTVGPLHAWQTTFGGGFYFWLSNRLPGLSITAGVRLTILMSDKITTPVQFPVGLQWEL